MLVIEVEGIKCRAFIESQTGSSYASSNLINKINKRPCCKECKRFGTLMNLVVRKTDTSKNHQPIEVCSKNNEIKMNINVLEFKPKRTVTAIASTKIKDVRENESNSN